MEKNLWSGLASRLVVFGLVALLIYWAMPDSGVSAMRKMNASMQNARSWRVQTVVTEPTKNVESMTEVYCPSRVHTVNKVIMDEGGQHYEENSESIWIEGTNYAKKGLRWVTSQEERSRTASCTWGPRGTDTLLQSLDAVLVAGKIHKGDKRIVNGERCRDWIDPRYLIDLDRKAYRGRQSTGHFVIALAKTVSIPHVMYWLGRSSQFSGLAVLWPEASPIQV
jgi:hypothetical protein